VLELAGVSFHVAAAIPTRLALLSHWAPECLLRLG
jgi:hypothetical protein